MSLRSSCRTLLNFASAGGLGVFGALGISLYPALAEAHIDLMEPAARVPGGLSGTQKVGPCGDQNGVGRSDDSVHEFSPGEEITIQLDESIDHPSYYRVAFSEDGEEFPERDDIASIVDQASDDPELNYPVDGTTILGYHYEDDDPMATSYEFTVTLPDVECENCTLQVVQFMYNNNSYYYQCADLKLVGEVSGEEGMGGSSAMEDGEGEGGASAEEGMGGAGESDAQGGMVSETGGASAEGGEGGSETTAEDALPSGGASPEINEPALPVAVAGAAATSGVAGAAGIPEAAGGSPSSGGAPAAGNVAGAPATALNNAGSVNSGTEEAADAGNDDDSGGCAVRAPRNGGPLDLGLWGLALVGLVTLARVRRS